MERYLGRMSGGQDPPDPNTGVQAAVFHKQPASNCTTYVSLGLSSHVVHYVGDSPPVRQELILSCYSRYESWRPGLILQMVAADVIADHHALHRGQILGPHGPLFEDSRLTALYCAGPVHLPRELARFTEFAEPTVFVWLVPISDDEARFAFEEGWRALEHLMDTEDPDLLALDRETMNGVRAPKKRRSAAHRKKKGTAPPARKNTK